MANRTDDATKATDWFQANGGPMRQVIVATPTAGGQYKVTVRKSASSPVSARTLSVVSTGLLESTADNNSQTKANCLFDWAERNFSDFFKPAGPAAATLNTYYYRFYTGTQAVLATNSADNSLYYLGPLTGGNLTNLGALPSFLAQSGCQ
jgi:hypothetical protein